MPKFRAMDLEAQKSDDDEDIDESENNDDSEDESSEGSRRSKKNVKKDIKKSWFDWISDHRYIIGILIVIAIVVGVTVYFFSFRATGEAQDINTARQKLGEFGPGPPDESRGGGEATTQDAG